MQARVDTGGGAGRGDHPAVLDEQRVRLDLRLRVRVDQGVDVHPVGGATASVEEAGGAEDERPAAQAHHPRTPVDGGPQFGQQRRVVTVGRWPTGGDGDEVGGPQPRPVVVRRELEPALGFYRLPWRRAADREVEGGDALCAAIGAEHLADDAQLEGRGVR